MTIKEKIIKAVNDYVKKNGYETWMSKKEFYDFVNSCYEGNIKTQSLIPTDYCYNRYNFGWEGVWLLEYDENKKLFRLLGENYPYTGDVWHFPQGQSPYIYGHWSKGILKRYY